MRSLALVALASASASALVLGGCGGEDAAPAGCDDYLTPAGSPDGTQTRIQTALIEASAGDTICFEGAFQLTDELSLAADGITLRAVGDGAELDFRTQEAGPNGIHVQSVDGFTVDGLVVKNTPGDGIRVTSSTDVVFRNTKVIWEDGPAEGNGAYGLYPVGCTNVLIEACEVSGAADAGIYVGQSENIVVRNNLAHGNVAGIEIENSKNAEVHDNEARDNTGGILVFDLPDLPAGQGGGVKVHSNTVVDNNQLSFAAIGSIVGYVPQGTGMMILTTDDIEIHDNTITGNQSSGLLILSYEVVEAVGAGGMPEEAYEPYPENISVHDNTFADNGTSPAGLTVMIGSPLEDILWDGLVDPAGTGVPQICIRNNGDASFRNFNLMLPDFDFGEPSFDLAPHDCEGVVLPAVELAL